MPHAIVLHNWAALYFPESKFRFHIDWKFCPWRTLNGLLSYPDATNGYSVLSLFSLRRIVLKKGVTLELFNDYFILCLFVLHLIFTFNVNEQLIFFFSILAWKLERVN